MCVGDGFTAWRRAFSFFPRSEHLMHYHSHELTLGLSFLLGILHALEPGHGKTAMLVYLLGGRRSAWHPLIMGASTAIAHSLSLLAIAFSVHLAHHLITGDHHHEHQVSRVLQWISALLVVAIGVWMLVQARRGRTASCGCAHHARGEAHHHDPHPQLVSLSGIGAPVERKVAEPPPPRPLHGFRTTAMLGFAVGLLPCPTALAALFTGLSTGGPGEAYLIVFLFAAGIALSLSVVGLLLQRFGDRLGDRFSRFSHLPWHYFRGSLIVAIGAVYTLRLVVVSG